jgi:hypothetical protein
MRGHRGRLRMQAVGCRGWPGGGGSTSWTPNAPARGETIAGRFRVTQAWVTDHDKWQLAAVQYTSLS